MKNSQEQKPRKLVKPGDLYRLGDHRLLCGDATKQWDVHSLMNGDLIDLLLTDPPYGVAYVESKQGFNPVSHDKIIQNDQAQTEEEYELFSRKWLKPLVPFFSKPNSIYIFNSDKMLFALRRAMEILDIRFSQLLLWVKHQAVVGRLDYMPQHELIIYGWKGTHKFLKSKDKSVLYCPKPNKSALHPTMKPISLLRRLILNSTEIGGVVVDTFGGSGSTLLACEQTKRKCLTMELDIEYCATIIMRWEKLTNNEAIFIKNIYDKKEDN